MSYLSNVHVVLVCIIGFAGIGGILVLISLQVQNGVNSVLRALDDVRAGERPPGYKAIEYCPSGAVKRTEAVPDGPRGDCGRPPARDLIFKTKCAGGAAPDS